MTATRVPLKPRAPRGPTRIGKSVLPCTSCGRELPADQFGDIKRKGRRDSKQSWCKECVRVQANGAYGRSRPEHIARVRANRLLREYGITVQEYDALLAGQDGCCAICRREPVDQLLAVDHDHETGVVRGLLCHRCNMGLGYFQDNIEQLLEAVAYLERAR